MEVKYQMDLALQSANWEKYSDRFYTYELCGIAIPSSPDLWRIPHYWGGKVDSGDVTPELYTAWAADKELYFNHYQGLNSRWKIPGRIHSREYDPVKHERDDFMIKTLERVNLREKRVIK